jgi:hypothetical protein
MNRANWLLLTALLGCYGCEIAFAEEAVSPTTTVERLIRAAKNNDLDAVLATADLVAISKGHSGMPPRRLIAVLRKIDLSKTRLLGKTQTPKAPRKKERVTLKGQYHWQFDLVLRENVRVEKAGRIIDLPSHYVVMSIHN